MNIPDSVLSSLRLFMSSLGNPGDYLLTSFMNVGNLMHCTWVTEDGSWLVIIRLDEKAIFRNQYNRIPHQTEKEPK